MGRFSWFTLVAWPRHLGLLALLVPLAIGGCGETSAPLGKVQGNVTYSGKPVPDALLVFHNDRHGIHITATADSAGQYRVLRADTEGLPPGIYKVAVTPPPATGGSFEAPPAPIVRDDIPPRFHKPDSSGLTVQVEPGVNQFDIDLGR